MTKVITFSRTFPSYHPKAGKPTYFVEKLAKSLHHQGWLPFDIKCDFDESIYHMCYGKHHTIRAGNRWKEGDKFSPRVWSGKPYNSKMITIAPDIEIKKVFDFETNDEGLIFINDNLYAYSSSIEAINKLAENDGLEHMDLLNWFKYPGKPFKGQIICWNENINY